MKVTVFPARSSSLPLLPLNLPNSQSLQFHHHHPSNPRFFFKIKPSSLNSLSFWFKFKPSRFRFSVRSLKSSSIGADAKVEVNQSQEASGFLEQPPSEFNVEVRNAAVPSNFPPAKLSLSDQAFFLLAFIACTVLL